MDRMKGMTLEAVTRACEGTYYGDRSVFQQEICGAVIDSRKVERGFLFIPIKGERVDGHDFIPQVLEQGALAVLSEKQLPEELGPYILVDSTEQALKRIAGFYRNSLGIPVVGISGSVGKTSTKEMIASVLEQHFRVHKTAGNFNNEIGLPLTILGIRSGHEVAVLEMGISDFGEMERLSALACPNVAVITNIGCCHLENLIDRDGVLQAKTEMFHHLAEHAAVILNGDDDKLMTKKQVQDREVIFYSVSEQKEQTAQIFATDVKNLGFEGMEACIHTPQGSFEAKIAIPGEHNVYNALSATAVGLELGLNLEEITAGIAVARTIAGRTNFMRAKGKIVIDDCYNANPMSMKSSLDTLSHAAGRTIAVLGDMGELGANERALHYEVGTAVAEKGIHTLFCAGELAEEYEKACRARAQELGCDCNVMRFKTVDSMLPELTSYVKEGDSVLVKASHFMNFGKVVEALTKQDESITLQSDNYK